MLIKSLLNQIIFFVSNDVYLHQIILFSSSKQIFINQMIILIKQLFLINFFKLKLFSFEAIKYL